MPKGVYFAIGAAVGAVGAWFYLKKKYEEKAEEEIESIRELYNRYQEKEKEQKKEPEPEKKPEVEEVKMENVVFNDYVRMINGRGTEPLDHPYVISPDEFGLFYDYEQIELHYYKDDVLTDDEGEPVDDDIGAMVGVDFQSHFGEYEDDAIYIRNDERKVDYEIIKEDINFHPAEGG